MAPEEFSKMLLREIDAILDPRHDAAVTRTRLVVRLSNGLGVSYSPRRAFRHRLAVGHSGNAGVNARFMPK
jgi:hypothetical protein